MSKATPEGTARYRKTQLEAEVVPEHFRSHDELSLSTLGLGTYLGNADDSCDKDYHDAIVKAVESGCNVIDTAINYRHQRSERCIGRAINTLRERGIDREALFVSTKGCFIPFDSETPSDAKDYVRSEYLDPGIMRAEDIVGGAHVLTPKYLENQLERSLANLELECIDLFYLHNPEAQLAAGVSKDTFLERMRTAFDFLEGAVVAGKIGSYGLATWNGLRTARNAPDFLDLVELHAVSSEAAAANDNGANHFRAVQLPFNLAMNEAFALPNQIVEGHDLAAIQAADALGLAVFTSASIAQGQLTQGLPDWLGTLFRGLQSDVQRAIQFVRSTPGVTTALVGMRHLAHVEENLGIRSVPPVPLEDYLKLFEIDGAE